jgi:hypothetical protein
VTREADGGYRHYRISTAQQAQPSLAGAGR